MASTSLTRQRSVSNRLEAPQIVLPKGKDMATDTPFEPCAATASHFLVAQGSTVLVLRHDTLALERRFQSHTDDLQLISVDNVSERGAGRLVVTYDVGKTAIIWDLFTGEQISRFASYEPLLVAAWMRNGNIAFGNKNGDVILFEPSTSEHISARTIFDPITALAPSYDCKTYAIGYRNGSILLAALQPQFTILHTLNTSRSPSPIAMLTWHASSSKQKSDMLAIQNSDGDLRVWSVPKPPTSGQPRVIRILKRDDRFIQGRNWISWSKNGRILQFSEGETWAWDVRTKDVNYTPVPTIEYVKGVAAHGPSASLFTLGPDFTIQQYDAESGQMMANVRHTPITIPPTPPEEYVRHFGTTSEDELASPLRANRYESDTYRSRSDLPASPHSHSQSTSSKKSTDRKPNVNVNELISPAKTERTATTFSMGAYAYNYPPAQNNQPSSPASTRGVPGLRKGSRLRQEVVMSPMTPEDAVAVELFPFARARLGEAYQQQSRPLNENSMTPDELRKHMLAIVFGWEDDIYALIADELSNHPKESLNSLFLTKWLEEGSEAIAELMESTPADPTLDWLRLALGTLDSRPECKKLGQIFVQKMLSMNEIHMAVVALLALGDRDDAIELYVEHKYYLEAILLTCLLMPQDWQRQSFLVRKWGEFVVENSQQNLAVRCFACTGADPGDTWLSPTSQMYSKITSPTSAILPQPPPLPAQLPQHQYQSPMAYPVSAPANPHLSRVKGRGFEAPTPVALIAPPTPFRTAAAKGTRITPQTGGLKLITSFGPKANMFKFPGLKTDDMTPTNATNITPIAESAIDRSALSPGGLGSYRLNNIQSLNSAMSAGPGSLRHRLPSIGETPTDVETPKFTVRNAPRAPPTPADSGSDKEKEKLLAAKVEAEKQEVRKEKSEQQLTLLTSARYNPTNTPVQNLIADVEPQTALRPSTNTSWHNPIGSIQEGISYMSNGSRGRRPDGLSLQVLQSKENPLDHLEPIPRPSTTDSTNTNFCMSPPDTSDSWRMKSPSVSGKSIDQYISSLEQAQFYNRTSRSRNSSRPPKETKEERTDRKRSKHRKHKTSEDINMPAGKRSPSSPVPMSPEDLHMFTASVESFDSVYNSHNASANDLPTPSTRHIRRESVSTTGTGKTRRRSRSAQPGVKRKNSTRGSRKTSPAPDGENGRRGRSKSRKESSMARSPSSPLPMLPSEDDLAGNTSTDPAFRFVTKDRSRLQRSTSRRPERGTSARRDQSPDRRRGRVRSPSRQRDSDQAVSRKNSVSVRDGPRKKREQSADTRALDRLNQDTLDRLETMAESMRSNTVSNPRIKTRSKELAQAELEARRLSLARRPSAPAIPMPGQGFLHSKSASEGVAAPPPLARNHTDSVLRPIVYNSSHQEFDAEGRPVTPRAMQAPAEQLQHHQNSQQQTLTSDAYQLPARTYSANAVREDAESWLANEVPQTMPRHPAFDHRVGASRGNSRSRTRGNSTERHRGKSVERPIGFPEEVPEEHTEDEIGPMVVGSPDIGYSEYRMSTGPAIIPELQHLAIPPPPPPPPAPPKAGLRIQTDISNIASIPLPKSAYPMTAELSSATPDKQHRRNSSRNEGQLIGKIRGITDRMRSTSKPRDNMSRSPNIEEGILSPYETVTMIPPPLASITERR